jgi:hypothetical protein
VSKFLPAAWRCTLLLALALPAYAEIRVYTDHTSFLADLQSSGHLIREEGFEDDAVWGGVRTTVVTGFSTAPIVASQGVAWASNFAAGNITTSEGASRSGNWGIFSYPHGSYATGINCMTEGACGDGFTGGAALGFYAIGGWIRTNTPYAKVGLILDGSPVDFAGAGTIGTNYEFFGAVSTASFSQFEFRELEGTKEDQKFIFGDDFYLAPVPEPSGAVLLLVGLGLVGFVARRRWHSGRSS